MFRKVLDKILDSVSRLGPIHNFFSFIFGRIFNNFIDRDITLSDFKKGICCLENLPLSQEKINKLFLQQSPYLLCSGSVGQLQIKIPSFSKLLKENIEVSIKNLELTFKPNKKIFENLKQLSNFKLQAQEMAATRLDEAGKANISQQKENEGVYEFQVEKFDNFNMLVRQIMKNLKVSVQNLVVKLYQSTPQSPSPSSNQSMQQNNVQKPNNNESRQIPDSNSLPQYFLMFRLRYIEVRQKPLKDLQDPICNKEQQQQDQLLSDGNNNKDKEKILDNQYFEANLHGISIHLLRSDIYRNEQFKPSDFPWTYPGVNHPSTIFCLGFNYNSPAQNQANIEIQINNKWEQNLKTSSQIGINVQLPSIEIMVEPYQIMITQRFIDQYLEFSQAITCYQQEQDKIRSQKLKLEQKLLNTHQMSFLATDATEQLGLKAPEGCRDNQQGEQQGTQTVNNQQQQDLTESRANNEQEPFSEGGKQKKKEFMKTKFEDSMIDFTQIYQSINFGINKQQLMTSILFVNKGDMRQKKGLDTRPDRMQMPENSIFEHSVTQKIIKDYFQHYTHDQQIPEDLEEEEEKDEATTTSINTATMISTNDQKENKNLEQQQQPQALAKGNLFMSQMSKEQFIEELIQIENKCKEYQETEAMQEQQQQNLQQSEAQIGYEFKFVIELQHFNIYLLKYSPQKAFLRKWMYAQQQNLNQSKIQQQYEQTIAERSVFNVGLMQSHYFFMLEGFNANLIDKDRMDITLRQIQIMEINIINQERHLDANIPLEQQKDQSIQKDQITQNRVGIIEDEDDEVFQSCIESNSMFIEDAQNKKEDLDILHINSDFQHICINQILSLKSNLNNPNQLSEKYPPPFEQENKNIFYSLFTGNRSFFNQQQPQETSSNAFQARVCRLNELEINVEMAPLYVNADLSVYMDFVQILNPLFIYSQIASSSKYHSNKIILTQNSNNQTDNETDLNNTKTQPSSNSIFNMLDIIIRFSIPEIRVALSSHCLKDTNGCSVEQLQQQMITEITQKNSDSVGFNQKQCLCDHFFHQEGSNSCIQASSNYFLIQILGISSYMSLKNLQVETVIQEFHAGLACLNKPTNDETDTKTWLNLYEIANFVPVNNTDTMIYYQTPDNNSNNMIGSSNYSQPILQRQFSYGNKIKLPQQSLHVAVPKLEIYLEYTNLKKTLKLLDDFQNSLLTCQELQKVLNEKIKSIDYELDLLFKQQVHLQLNNKQSSNDFMKDNMLDQSMSQEDLQIQQEQLQQVNPLNLESINGIIGLELERNNSQKRNIILFWLELLVQECRVHLQYQDKYKTRKTNYTAEEMKELQQHRMDQKKIKLNSKNKQVKITQKLKEVKEEEEEEKKEDNNEQDALPDLDMHKCESQYDDNFNNNLPKKLLLWEVKVNEQCLERSCMLRLSHFIVKVNICENKDVKLKIKLFDLLISDPYQTNIRLGSPTSLVEDELYSNVMGKDNLAADEDILIYKHNYFNKNAVELEKIIAQKIFTHRSIIDIAKINYNKIYEYLIVHGKFSLQFRKPKQQQQQAVQQQQQQQQQQTFVEQQQQTFVEQQQINQMQTKQQLTKMRSDKKKQQQKQEEEDRKDDDKKGSLLQQPPLDTGSINEIAKEELSEPGDEYQNEESFEMENDWQQIKKQGVNGQTVLSSVEGSMKIIGLVVRLGDFNSQMIENLTETINLLSRSDDKVEEKGRQSMSKQEQQQPSSQANINLVMQLEEVCLDVFPFYDKQERKALSKLLDIHEQLLQIEKRNLSYYINQRVLVRLQLISEAKFTSKDTSSYQFSCNANTLQLYFLSFQDKSIAKNPLLLFQHYDDKTDDIMYSLGFTKICELSNMQFKFSSIINNNELDIINNNQQPQQQRDQQGSMIKPSLNVDLNIQLIQVSICQDSLEQLVKFFYIMQYKLDGFQGNCGRVDAAELDSQERLKKPSHSQSLQESKNQQIVEKPPRNQAVQDDFEIIEESEQVQIEKNYKKLQEFNEIRKSPNAKQALEMLRDSSLSNIKGQRNNFAISLCINKCQLELLDGNDFNFEGDESYEICDYEDCRQQSSHHQIKKGGEQDASTILFNSQENVSSTNNFSLIQDQDNNPSEIIETKLQEQIQAMQQNYFDQNNDLRNKRKQAIPLAKIRVKITDRNSQNKLSMSLMDLCFSFVSVVDKNNNVDIKLGLTDLVITEVVKEKQIMTQIIQKLPIKKHNLSQFQQDIQPSLFLLSHIEIENNNLNAKFFIHSIEVNVSETIYLFLDKFRFSDLQSLSVNTRGPNNNQELPQQQDANVPGQFQQPQTFMASEKMFQEENKQAEDKIHAGNKQTANRTFRSNSGDEIDFFQSQKNKFSFSTNQGGANLPQQQQPNQEQPVKVLNRQHEQEFNNQQVQQDAQHNPQDNIQISYIYISNFQVNISVNYYIKDLIKAAQLNMPQILCEREMPIKCLVEHIKGKYMKVIDLNIQKNPEIYQNLEKIIVIRNISNIIKGIGGLIYYPYYYYQQNEGLASGLQKGVSNFKNSIYEETGNFKNVTKNIIDSLNVQIHKVPKMLENMFKQKQQGYN